MSIYYIMTQEGEIYAFQSTSAISYTLTGDATSNIVESGNDVSDHYVQRPSEIKLLGVITDIRSPSNSNSRPTKQAIDGLIALKNSRRPFSFIYGSKIGVIPNCVFLGLEFTQTAGNGSVGAIDSFKVNITLKQVRVAERARIERLRDPLFVADASKDSYQGKASGKGTADSPKEEAQGRITLGLEQLGEVVSLE